MKTKKQKTKNETTTIRISKETQRRLKILAAQGDVTMRVYIETLVNRTNVELK